MTKKAPIMYPSLSLAPPASPAAPAIERATAEHLTRTSRMRDLADQVMLYLNPAGHKELKRYAIGADRKVHDLLIEAVEEWAAKRGIREQMRVR